MKVLCVHGIGHQETSSDVWQPLWTSAITTSLREANSAEPIPNIDYFDYDEEFEASLAKLSYSDLAKALWNLGNGAFRRPRGMFDLSDSTRWHAGMVAVWINDADLREQLRALLSAAIDRSKPDLICAHSLGSLIAYDTFAHDDAGIRGKTFITLGSQIGNVFVRGSAFAGRVGPLEAAAQWFHLYNPYDHVFTAPLDFGEFQTAANFRQVETRFGRRLSGFADNHTAVDPDNPDKAYLTHPQTAAVVWPLIAGHPIARAMAAPAKTAKVNAVAPTPTRRALLVGINAYPDPAQRLEGCVNDVFLMSSVLQECGFDAEDIRVVFDDRATAAGVRERLHWLLDGVQDGDTRVFYFSGHGAPLPLYGPEGKIDRVASCLVPYDFNWTPKTAITDRDLVDLYSQLAYDARLMMVFDCCYSGGLTRGGTRVRGLDPPDDIRHRMLRWDPDVQMWMSRDLRPLNRDLQKKDSKQFAGDAGATLRLGRGVALRAVPDKEYDKTRKDLDHKGPFMPVVYEACGEKEFAYEYQHGAVGHGAFTFAMAAALRRHGAAGKEVTFGELLKETARILKALQFDQHPEVAGPKAVLKMAVPWKGAGKPTATEV